MCSNDCGRQQETGSSGMAAAQAAQGPWPAAFQRALASFREHFERLGLTAADLPAAIIVHEVLGAAMALGFWATCYAGRPSRRLAAAAAQGAAAGARGLALQRAYDAAMTQATRTVAKMSWLRAVSVAACVLVHARNNPPPPPLRPMSTHRPGPASASRRGRPSTLRDSRSLWQRASCSARQSSPLPSPSRFGHLTRS